jgi:hypothetical protein
MAKASLADFATAPQTEDGKEVVQELRMAFGLASSRDNEESAPTVGEMPERKILAKFPAVLAVARVGSSEKDRKRGWNLSAPDPETTDIIENELKGLDAISRIEPLLSFNKNTPTLAELKRMAAAVGADLLFVYTDDSVVEGYFNALGWGYFTGIGLFCIPGNSVQATAATQGLLLDVKSGFPLCVVTVKKKTNGMAIALVNYGDKKDSCRTAADTECDKEMAQRLVKKIASVVATMK